jgi:hypothetical protein
MNELASLFATPRPARPCSADPVCTVAIDAEEDFDWLHPVQGTRYSTGYMQHSHALHTILGAYGCVPVHLITYPVLQDADAVRGFRRRLERGECVLGLQLHAWVTPPFDSGSSLRQSFAGNLPPDLEERKLLSLKQRFEACFGFAPRVFRAGRYGLGPHTAALLEKHGIDIDVSLAPRTSFADEGGPDFTGHDYRLFWFGARRTLLEVPLCRSVIGWGGAPAQRLFSTVAAPALARFRLGGLLSRLRIAERVTLSPEGNDTAAMRRLVRHLRRRGQNILALSFHSSSLQVGRNPYVQSRADLHRFYDRLSAMLDHLASGVGCRFVSLLDVPALLLPPAPP